MPYKEHLTILAIGLVVTGAIVLLARSRHQPAPARQPAQSAVAAPVATAVQPVAADKPQPEVTDPKEEAAWKARYEASKRNLAARARVAALERKRFEGAAIKEQEALDKENAALERARAEAEAAAGTDGQDEDDTQEEPVAPSGGGRIVDVPASSALATARAADVGVLYAWATW